MPFDLNTFPDFVSATTNCTVGIREAHDYYCARKAQLTDQLAALSKATTEFERTGVFVAPASLPEADNSLGVSLRSYSRALASALKRPCRPYVSSDARNLWVASQYTHVKWKSLLFSSAKKYHGIIASLLVISTEADYPESAAGQGEGIYRVVRRGEWEFVFVGKEAEKTLSAWIESLPVNPVSRVLLNL